jgi:hypothetical protein
MALMSRAARIEQASDMAPPSRRLSALRPIPRRGLSRIEAAMYIGVGVGKFNELVLSGRMPKPKCIDNRKVWDILALDLAFDLMPDEDGLPTGSTWDDV